MKIVLKCAVVTIACSAIICEKEGDRKRRERKRNREGKRERRKDREETKRRNKGDGKEEAKY